MQKGRQEQRGRGRGLPGGENHHYKKFIIKIPYEESEAQKTRGHTRRKRVPPRATRVHWAPIIEADFPAGRKAAIAGVDAMIAIDVAIATTTTRAGGRWWPFAVMDSN